MMSDFKNYLSNTTLEILKEKDQFFLDWCSYTQTINPKLENFSRLLKDTIGGGKMLRGTLLRLGADTATAKSPPDLFKIAAAYEIIHTSLLIHDDIIDKSDTRRGKPTLYKQLGGNHYGISQGICLGDMGFFLATKLIAQSTLSDTTKNTILQMFSHMLLDTILGEMLDVELSLPNKKVLESEILTMQKMKTAYYTIVWPLLIGATLGGAEQKKIDDMKLFGESLGIAFQIQDDILGIFGDEKTVGKSVTSDITEGKNTLLICYALQHATTHQKELLTTYYGNGTIDDMSHKLIKKLFIETGALYYSQITASKYISKGEKVIPQLTNNPLLQNHFYALAKYTTTRSI